MREESFYDPPEILSFDEAQRLLDRGESRIVDFGGALILGDPGSVLILRRRGVCLKRGNIVGSGGLVEFAVRAGDGEVHEQVRHTVLLVEADDAEVSESLVCGCERTSAAPSCTVTVQGAVLGVALRRCTIEGDGVEAAFREHFGSFADAQDMLYTSHGAPWGCDGVHIIGRGTEADVTGCSISRHSGIGLVVAAGADAKVLGSAVSRNGQHGVACIGPGSIVELDRVQVSGNAGAGVATAQGGSVHVSTQAPWLWLNVGGPWVAGSQLTGRTGLLLRGTAVLYQSLLLALRWVLVAMGIRMAVHDQLWVPGW